VRRLVHFTFAETAEGEGKELPRLTLGPLSSSRAGKEAGAVLQSLVERRVTSAL